MGFCDYVLAINENDISDWHSELLQREHVSLQTQPDEQRLRQTVCRAGDNRLSVCDHHCIWAHLHLLAAPPSQNEEHGKWILITLLVKLSGINAVHNNIKTDFYKFQMIQLRNAEMMNYRMLINILKYKYQMQNASKAMFTVRLK